MKIAAKALTQLLAARGLTLDSLSRRTDISRHVLQDVLEGRTELEDEDIVALADEFSVPVPALFSQQDLALLPAVDFRAAVPRRVLQDRGTIQAMSFVERLSSTLGGLGLDLNPSDDAAPIDPDLTRDEAVKLAKKWRANWGFTIQEQLEAEDANRVYTSLRTYIESLGVVVLHYSFRIDDVGGLYSRVDGGPHTIVINSTKSSKGRKLFTLAHEFCHFLMRREGVSNPSIARNKVEKFCNWFASILIAPDSLISRGLSLFGYRPSADNDFIRLFAKRLGISQEALVIRLVEMGYLTHGQYTSWKSQFDGKTPIGDQGERGGRSNPLQNKLTQYGGRLLSLLNRAKINGDLDEIDIYRLCGLKPKYQKQLFEAV
jgi:Zn-dependent peptidase ImmA (M78 family)